MTMPTALILSKLKFARNVFSLTHQKSREGTSIGTCGKVQQLTHKLKWYQRDIKGLPEVRRTGFGETTTDNGHKLWYIDEDSRHKYNMGFLVHRKVAKSAVHPLG